jgi:MFS transporter, Spinster family, sphingosine-1-phosphate transporter
MKQMRKVTSSTDGTLKVSKRKVLRYPLYVFCVLFAIGVLNSLNHAILAGAANVMSKELHLNIADIGYLSSAFIIFFTISVLPLGVWSDRAKRKTVIAVAVAVWSIATAFTALASSFIILLLSRMVLGVSEAGSVPSSEAMISDYFSRTRRARAMSWLAAADLVGLMLGTIIGGGVAGLYYGAWRLAFLLAIIPGLVLICIVWYLREPRRNEADEELDAQALEDGSEMETSTHLSSFPKNVFSQFHSLLRIRTLLVLIVMQVFASFVVTGTVTYLSIFLQQKDTLGMSSAEAGLYTGLGLVLAGITGVILGGYVADWLGRRFAGARVLVCGLSFLLGAPCYCISVLVAVNLHNLGLYSISFAITAILLNMNTGPLMAATQDVAPAALRASAVAITLFVSHILGDAFAPSFLGWLASSFDPTGYHFAHNMAGHDLTRALIYAYPASLTVAGIIGIIGSRWMKGDVAAAQRINLLSSKILN